MSSRSERPRMGSEPPSGGRDRVIEAARIAAKTRVLLGAVEFWLNGVTALLVGSAGALLYLELHARGLPAMFVIASALSLIVLLLIAVTRFFAVDMSLNRSLAFLVGVLVCLALIGFGLTIWPQGRIVVRVLDEGDRGGVEGVAVELLAKGRGARTGTTNDMGAVGFERVPIGEYSLHVAANPPVAFRGVLAPWGRATYEVDQARSIAASAHLTRSSDAPSTLASGEISPRSMMGLSSPDGTSDGVANAADARPNPTPVCRELLVDGGFDRQSEAWQLAPTDKRSPVRCQSALASSQPCLLTLGERETEIEVFQTVSVSETTSSRISFLYYVRARAPEQEPGYCRVLVRDAQTGAPILVIATLIPSADAPQTFVRFHYDLTPEEIAFLARRGAAVHLVFSLSQRERLGMVVYIEDVTWTECS